MQTPSEATERVAAGWILAAAAGLTAGGIAAFEPEVCRLSMMAAGALAAIAIYAAIVTCWRRAFYGLLIYLPFAGAVTLALYPSTLPLLFKDLLFVVPAYLGFIWSSRRGRETWAGIPLGTVVLLVLFAAIVIVQSANPGTRPLVALIGLKVWLFYIPLFFLSGALVRSRQDLVRLLRWLVILSLVPCAIGIAEFLAVRAHGYEETMSAIYGAEAAAAATQRFSRFDFGAALLVRIPSTFTYVSQYFGFSLAMIVPCYALLHLETSKRWFRAAVSALVVNVLACFLSGARSAFVFVPLLIVLTLLIERRISGVALACASAAGLSLGALWLLGMNLVALYEVLSQLVGSYAENTAYGTLIEAITTFPLGAGTGTNTGPARYAYAESAALALAPSYESYYGKAAHELGIVGLIVVVALFGALTFHGLACRAKLSDPGLRACASAVVAFLVTMALNSFKGWQIDLDPINVYFWMFGGLLTALPSLERRSTVPSQARR